MGLQLRKPFGGADEFVELDRFVEVFADAEAFGVHLVARPRVAGDHDDERLGVAGFFGLDLFEDEEAAAAEHGAALSAVPALLCLTSTPPREYLLRNLTTTIGRGPRCDLRISANFVSREHARVIRRGTSVEIEDLESRNGVFVNAVRIAREVLRDGDLITIGEMQFRYRAG